jgi:hypothetical protein
MCKKVTITLFSKLVVKLVDGHVLEMGSVLTKENNSKLVLSTFHENIVDSDFVK